MSCGKNHDGDIQAYHKPNCEKYMGKWTSSCLIGLKKTAA
jgi:hypothetical protein